MYFILTLFTSPKHHRDEITLFSSNVVFFVYSTYVCTTLFSCNVVLFVFSTYICNTYIHINCIIIKDNMQVVLTLSSVYTSFSSNDVFFVSST